MPGKCTGRTDKPIRPARETKTDEFIKPKPKKVSKLKNQPRDDFQLDMTNRYDSLSGTDSDKDTDQPKPKKKQNKAVTTKPENKEEIHNNSSQGKLATETSNTENDIITRIPKYIMPIIINKTLDYNRLITLLNAEIVPQYKITFTQQEIKVLTTTMHAYNTTKDTLKKRNIHFHTFTPREEKSHSAILKGLPASIGIVIIKQELTEFTFTFNT
ncbi:hypothetical protein PR048_012037 [Dryococelus australis]|uniref:Uncharacterized protein n=1 Tax=Dryococelus australis TaxID=614101 RepID=A0ABQ9HNL2_9NEOP|nr:hypothetical protein PR048_012037 [Dryococelus australis]